MLSIKGQIIQAQVKNKNHELEIVLFLRIWQKGFKHAEILHTSVQDPGLGGLMWGKVLKQGQMRKGMGVEENKGDQVCRQMSEKRKETFGHSLCMRVKSLQSCLTLCDPMDCSLPGSPALGFSRQEYQSGLLCPPPGDLPNPGIETLSPVSPALADRFFTTSATWEAQTTHQPVKLYNCF